MDAFGIGTALKGVMRIYFHSARRSGRTTALLESLSDGDRVVCLTDVEGKRLQALARELGVTITYLVFQPSSIRTIFDYPTSGGRTVFDHTWIEAYYEKVLEDAAEQIDRMQRESSFASRPGMAHVKTRLAAQEAKRWQL